jgi:uncharacterized protein
MRQIKIDRIPPGGLAVDFLLEPAWLKEIAEERPLGFVPSGPLDVQGELSRTGEGILFRGIVRGKIRLDCGRCLESFLESLNESVSAEWRLVSAPSKSADQDGGLQIEDLDTGQIQEGTVDLGERILEEVILTIPIQPLCREACLGLCPICGENKNINPCSCKAKEGSSPFSVLKKFQV